MSRSKPSRILVEYCNYQYEPEETSLFSDALVILVPSDVLDPYPSRSGSGFICPLETKGQARRFRESPNPLYLVGTKKIRSVRLGTPPAGTRIWFQQGTEWFAGVVLKSELHETKAQEKSKKKAAYASRRHLERPTVYERIVFEGDGTEEG